MITSDGSPKLKWRVIEPWLDPSGKEQFTHGGNVFTWDGMLNLAKITPLGKYLEQLQQWHFNAIALYCNPEDNLEAFRSFCRYVKPMGIRVFIRRNWNEIEEGKSWPMQPTKPRPRTSQKLNPFDPQVREYWKQRVERDVMLFPDIGGYRLSGTEFYFDNGAPWMGEGPELVGKTGGECVEEAIRLIAGELTLQSLTLFWETIQDDPWGQRQEYWYFRDLAGRIPENALVLIKNHYWDYHPRWPVHPLNYAITKDAEGRSPFITSIQLPGEYTGVNDFPWCQVDDIADTIKRIRLTGQQGIWVMAQPLPEHPWDHPLNGANWHALAELICDSEISPRKLKLSWATGVYGAAAAATIVEILDEVTQAARAMFEFDGLWNAAHSRFPTLAYLDSHLCGPLRCVPRMKGMMGLVLPLDMYPPDVEAEIRKNRTTRLVFNQVPISGQLRAEAITQKEDAVQTMRSAISRWLSLRGIIQEDDYETMLRGLLENLSDSLAFRGMMDLYMDWKLGLLTEAKIDTVLGSCRGLKGRVVPDLLDPNPERVTVIEPASLKTFAEELRLELKQPWLEQHWRDNPNPHVTYVIPTP